MKRTNPREVPATIKAGRKPYKKEMYKAINMQTRIIEMCT